MLKKRADSEHHQAQGRTGDGEEQPRAAGGRNRNTNRTAASSRSPSPGRSSLPICAYLIIAPEDAREVVNGEDHVEIASCSAPRRWCYRGALSQNAVLARLRPSDVTVSLYPLCLTGLQIAGFERREGARWYLGVPGCFQCSAWLVEPAHHTHRASPVIRTSPSSGGPVKDSSSSPVQAPVPQHSRRGQLPLPCECTAATQQQEQAYRRHLLSSRPPSFQVPPRFLPSLPLSFPSQHPPAASHRLCVPIVPSTLLRLPIPNCWEPDESTPSRLQPIESESFS